MHYPAFTEDARSFFNLSVGLRERTAEKWNIFIPLGKENLKRFFRGEVWNLEENVVKVLTNISMCAIMYAVSLFRLTEL